MIIDWLANGYCLLVGCCAHTLLATVAQIQIVVMMNMSCEEEREAHYYYYYHYCCYWRTITTTMALIEVQGSGEFIQHEPGVILHRLFAFIVINRSGFVLEGIHGLQTTVVVYFWWSSDHLLHHGWSVWEEKIQNDFSEMINDYAWILWYYFLVARLQSAILNTAILKQSWSINSIYQYLSPDCSVHWLIILPEVMIGILEYGKCDKFWHGLPVGGLEGRLKI